MPGLPLVIYRADDEVVYYHENLGAVIWRKPIRDYGGGVRGYDDQRMTVGKATDRLRQRLLHRQADLLKKIHLRRELERC